MMTQQLARATKRFPYPFETLRRCYITKFGGTSSDLQLDQLGVLQEALEENTEILDTDRVAVGVLGKGRSRPFFMDRLYEVVALDQGTLDALLKSPLGEAVFSPEFDRDRRPFDSMKEGDMIVISAVLVFKKNVETDWQLDLLAKALCDLRVTES